MGQFTSISDETDTDSTPFSTIFHFSSVSGHYGFMHLFVNEVLTVDLTRVMLEPSAAYIFSAHIFYASGSYISAEKIKVMRGQSDKSEVGNLRKPL